MAKKHYRYIPLSEVDERELILTVIGFVKDYFCMGEDELPRFQFYEQVEIPDDTCFSLLSNGVGYYQFHKDVNMGNIEIRVDRDNWIGLTETIVHEVVHHLQKLDAPHIKRSKGWEYLINYWNEPIEIHAEIWQREAFAAYNRERSGIPVTQNDVEALERWLGYDNFFTPERKEAMLNRVRGLINDKTRSD